jgi:hypothetical protein
MAMCDLQPAHRSLTLRAAMSLSYKHKNYITGIYDIKIRFLDFKISYKIALKCTLRCLIF